MVRYVWEKSFAMCLLSLFHSLLCFVLFYYFFFKVVIITLRSVLNEISSRSNFFVLCQIIVSNYLLLVYECPRRRTEQEEVN